MAGDERTRCAGAARPALPDAGQPDDPASESSVDSPAIEYLPTTEAPAQIVMEEQASRAAVEVGGDSQVDPDLDSHLLDTSGSPKGEKPSTPRAPAHVVAASQSRQEPCQREPQTPSNNLAHQLDERRISTASVQGLDDAWISALREMERISRSPEAHTELLTWIDAESEENALAELSEFILTEDTADSRLLAKALESEYGPPVAYVSDLDRRGKRDELLLKARLLAGKAHLERLEAQTTPAGEGSEQP